MSVGRGDRFVFCEFDRNAGTHPKTGEPVEPPICVTFMAHGPQVGICRSIVTFLQRTYGWSGEIQEEWVCAADAEG